MIITGFVLAGAIYGNDQDRSSQWKRALISQTAAAVLAPA